MEGFVGARNWSGKLGLPAKFEPAIREVTDVIVNASAPALLLPKNKSNDEMFETFVFKLIVTSKKPVVAVMSNVDGVAMNDDWASAAVAAATAQVKVSKSFFMNFVQFF